MEEMRKKERGGDWGLQEENNTMNSRKTWKAGKQILIDRGRSGRRKHSIS